MPSGRDDGEGDDLRAVRQFIVQRRTDRRAARQRPEIQSDLAGGAGRDDLPTDLDRESAAAYISAMIFFSASGYASACPPGRCVYALTTKNR
jgi:hypothetical protein